MVKQWIAVAMMGALGVSMSARASYAEDAFQVAPLVDATATSDGIQRSEAKPSATGALGLVASKDLGCGVLSFAAAFAGGTTGSQVTGASAADYFAFLRSPKSALGGELRAAFQWRLGKPWISLGPALALRASSVTLQPSGEGVPSQHVAVVGGDLVAALTVTLKPGTQLHVDAGVASRFWNKPRGNFVDALGLKDDAHAFFGPRGSVYFDIENLTVGVELSRYWGGDLERFKEFTILPYVGISLGGALAKKADPPPADPPPAPSPPDDPPNLIMSR